MKFFIVKYSDVSGFAPVKNGSFDNSGAAIAKATEYAEKHKQEHLVIEIPPSGRRRVIALLRPKKERYNLKVKCASAGE